MSTEIIDGPTHEALGSDGIAVSLARASRLTAEDLRREPPAVTPPTGWGTAPRTGAADTDETKRGPAGIGGGGAGDARGAGGRVTLPAAPGRRPHADDLDTLHGTLSRRASVRFFSERPLAPDALSAMLHAVAGEDAAAYPGEAEGGSPLELLVAPLRVEGVEPALFHATPDGTGADLVRVADLPADRHDELVLQREFAGAAALVFVMGSLRAAEERHGPHGHRLGLVRAGCAAHAGWLHAIERGLTGTVFAGALPTALRGLAGVDGHERTQLFALAVGHPAFG